MALSTGSVVRGWGSGVTTPLWLPFPELSLSAQQGLGNLQVPSFTLHSRSASVTVTNHPKI